METLIFIGVVAVIAYVIIKDLNDKY
ncbi:uncharacterized protein METZ01_LOCUS254669 [marine metagenome]|uniref:Uncharacterized protein n=1 Tax=marine metagenome TaxID=408172 RepID=A0A382IR33_9ZZZZ